jgi:hypothetical protein
MTMSDLNQYIPLKQIVSYALDETDQSIGSFDRFWIMAFRALADLFMDIYAESITVRIPVSGNKTVAFPSDYISWVKIGVLNNNGEVSTLKINNALTTYKGTNPNRIEKLTSDITDALPLLLNNPYYLNYYNGGQYQPLFGVGGGLIQYGECRVDDKNNLIILSPDFRFDSIILEYISSPEKNGDYQVPLACQEAVISFIKWKSKQGSRDEYIAEKINARRRMPNKRVNLQNINAVIRESNGQKLLA